MDTKCERASLLATTATIAMALASLTTTPAAAQDAAAQDAAAEVQELVVTGSRIPRPNLDQPTPVGVLQVEDARSPLALGDIIARLPQAGFSGTLRANSNNFGTTAGLNAVNLRNLGVSRTLVLVDGQRHVAGDLSTNAVDLNSIPPGLIDRVEVVTGGASAVYGSDAVTGVVNIITKKQFEGLQLDVTGGRYDAGFGGSYSASASAGRNFLDDRLNLTVSGFWRKDSAIDARDIPAANNYQTIVNPADLALGANDPSFFTGFRFSGPTIPNNGVPDRLFVPNVGSELTTRNGVLVNAVSGSAIVFDAAGNPVATPRRTGYNSFAFGQLPNCVVCSYPEDFKEVASQIETGGFAFKASYDFTPKIRGFIDAKFVENNVENNFQPSFTPSNGVNYFLMPDNAYLTPAIGAALAQDGGQFYVFSRWLNNGRSQDIRRRTYRAVAGLEGDWDADFATVKWNAALNYGETGVDIRYHNVMLTENFAAALDSVIDPSTGRPACRINVPSVFQTGQGAGALSASACAPYNPFGLQNSAAAMAYSFGDFTTKDRLTQQVASLNASFDTGKFLNLPGGPVGVATGAEYRMERIHERSDPLLTSGATENFAVDSAGGFNVVEGYLELNAPIFRNAGPLMDELSIDAAWRGADYSTVGKVAAYKVGGVYGPTDWLKFRGTWSRSVRAPNISEAYSPLVSTAFIIRDPCSVENIGTNVNFARNCAAAGIPAGFTATSNAGVVGTLSGNPNLDAERSRSWTVGFVVQPPMVRNLTITLDYYSIRIKDAITQVSAQDIVDNCYASSAGLDPTYCALFTRGDRSLISGVQTTYVNASKLFTDGFELQVNYAADVGALTQGWGPGSALDGRLNFQLTADYVVTLRNYPFQNNPGDVNVLEGTATTLFGNNPQLKAVADVSYSQGPVTVGWTTRYIGRQALFSRDPSAAQGSESLNIPFTEPTFYHDLAVSYRMQGGLKGLELYAGAQNLFDEEPPFTVLGSNRDAAFDLGRFLYVGARFRR